MFLISIMASKSKRDERMPIKNISKAKKIEKPWGYELIFAHTEHYAGKILFINEGHRFSLQFHQFKDETIYIYKGKIRLHFGDPGNELVEQVLEPGDSVRIKPLTRHRMEALEDSTLLEVSTSELDDVQRLQDDYGRA